MAKQDQAGQVPAEGDHAKEDQFELVQVEEIPNDRAPESQDVFSTVRIASLHKAMEQEIASKSYKGYCMDLELTKDKGHWRGAYAVELHHESLHESYRFITCPLGDCEKTNTTWRFGDTIMKVFMNKRQTWIPTTDQFGTLLLLVKFLRDLFPTLMIRELLVDATEIKDLQMFCHTISDMACWKLCSRQYEHFESALMNQLVSSLESVKYLEIGNLEEGFIFEQPEKITEFTTTMVSLEKLMTLDIESLKFNKATFSTEEILKIFNSWKEGEARFQVLTLHNRVQLDWFKLAHLIGFERSTLGTFQKPCRFDFVVEKRDGSKGKVILDREFAKYIVFKSFVADEAS